MFRLLLLLFCTFLLCKKCSLQEQYGCLLPTKQGLVLGTCPYKGHAKDCPKPSDCGFKYPKTYSEMYECYIDFDCASDNKCCKHPCFEHKVCLMAQ